MINPLMVFKEFKLVIIRNKKNKDKVAGPKKKKWISGNLKLNKVSL